MLSQQDMQELIWYSQACDLLNSLSSDSPSYYEAMDEADRHMAYFAKKGMDANQLVKEYKEVLGENWDPRDLTQELDFAGRPWDSDYYCDEGMEE